jgi:hypothetical protein
MMTRRSFVKVAFFCLSLSVALLLFIGFLPQILSTKQGTRLLVALINKGQTNTLEVGSLSLSWRKGQEVDDLRIFNAEREELFYCPKITSSAPLWNILIAPTGEKEIRFCSPTLHLRASSFIDGVDSSLPIQLPFASKVIIENGSIKTD